MKSIFIFIAFLFVLNYSLAQSQITDTTTLHVRGSTAYYIDGVKVSYSSLDSCKVTSIEDIRVIIGGVPVIYGDINSSLIQISPSEPVIIPQKTKDKKQQMASE